jgi:NAD(P)-dependent dehydrogenase (short-subunit alcohol dehydrogenase family)
MSRIFITGSSDGLGLAAGRHLIDQGHAVVLHARNRERADQTRTAAPGAEAVVAGDVSRADDTEDVARRVNDLGVFDTVIHNVAIGYREPRRISTPESHAHLLAVNVLAPYILTARITRPERLVYLSSGMHQGGSPSTYDLDWKERPWNSAQAYADSKLYDLTLAFAFARLWPEVRSNAVDPGWVPTKMGGPAAPDNLEQGHVTQSWLATSSDSGALVTGEYFRDRRKRRAYSAARSVQFQDELLGALEDLTGVALPT